MLALWLLSLRLRDSSIVDLFWGPAFALVAWVELAAAAGSHPRRLLFAALVSLWALRLAGYLAWRNLGRGEDPRYAAMRARHGSKWPLRSLAIVFGLQGALVLLVGLPVHAVMGLTSQPPLGWLDALGAAVFATGLGIESLGDLQLARFKAKPENQGRVMNQGLWRYTRHPNYFGDFLVWWGLFLVAAATGWGALSVAGPALMTVLLLRVSGVTLLEASMKQRPGYAEYIARTSAFFPRPPRA
jgi:steroid 5-alpha reductase family enzyme